MTTLVQIFTPGANYGIRHVMTPGFIKRDLAGTAFQPNGMTEAEFIPVLRMQRPIALTEPNML